MVQNMEKVPDDYYRYERKFLVSHTDRESVERMIMMHPAFFREIFYERYVNNIYFDNLAFDNFIENIDGNTDRTKYRIRWYGEMGARIKNPKLEVKVKKNLIGYKKSYDLSHFDISSQIKITSIRSVIEGSITDQKIKFILKDQIPVFLNRYRRKYFATSDYKFRITVDDDQSFYKFSSLSNSFLVRQDDREHIILELKYSKENDYLASLITNYFPFRLTKSSKYTQGIRLLYS